MRLSPLFSLFKWTAALGVLAGLLYVAYRVNGEMQAERAREGGETIETTRRARDGLVSLTTDEIARYGLKEEPARAGQWTPSVTVYGQVVPNPRATVEVRSPFAGTLRAAADKGWPAPGQWVGAGQVLGWVDVRVPAQERLTLHDSLNQARSKREGAEKVRNLEQERVRRLTRVSDSQIIPGQQLDDARVLLANAETELAIATAAVKLWQKALDEVDRPGSRTSSLYSQPLLAPADGEVVELPARPGMAVEAGSLLARLVDFRRPLVRLEMPPVLVAEGPPRDVRLLALSAPAAGLTGALPDPGLECEAALVGPAPRVDAASQRVGLWYAVRTAAAAGSSGDLGAAPQPSVVWRPGLQVRASVASASARAQPAVIVPAEAVLFHQGRPLVYVRTRPGGYERREVNVLARHGGTCVLAPGEAASFIGVAPGDVVVSNGAQVLLSEEFRSDVESDD